MPQLNPNPSALAKLSIEHQQQLIAWLDTYPLKVVVQKVASEPPDGFGIATHPTSLRRFYARHHAQDRAEDADIAKLFASPDSTKPVETATENLVEDCAFQFATKPRQTIGHFKALSRWILKKREHEQHEREFALLLRRLDLDREKFEFNAAREALEHFQELGDVLKSPETDDEDKINRARSILFGIPIDQLQSKTV